MYNGHRSRNQWNVAMWFANDEGLYRMALEYMRGYGTKDEAAKKILEDLIHCGMTKTPDGTPYTFTNIRAALVGLT